MPVSTAWCAKGNKHIKAFYSPQPPEIPVRDHQQYFREIFLFAVAVRSLKEFDALNAVAPAWMKGHMVWLVIPCSVAVSWMYASLEQVDQSTENPFEGSANDVPSRRFAGRSKSN